MQRTIDTLYNTNDMILHKTMYILVSSNSTINVTYERIQLNLNYNTQ